MATLIRLAFGLLKQRREGVGRRLPPVDVPRVGLCHLLAAAPFRVQSLGLLPLAWGARG